MTAAQAKEMMKIDSGKNYKVVPKKKKIDFMAENRKHLKGRPKNAV
jgi:hypothetical protein